MPVNFLQQLSGHQDTIWTLSWNPTGTLLASSGSDKTIRLWAESNNHWSCVSILRETHSKSIRRICWSPCGRYLASASFDSTVCIWRKKQSDEAWEVVVNLEGHESEVKSVAWSHDGKYLASCGRDKAVWIWERSTLAREDQEGESVEEWDCSDVKSDHTKDVKHIVWHPQHNILVSCSYDDSIKMFHHVNGDWVCFNTLKSHSSTVWSADFSANGEYLATCSDDRTVRVWKNQAHGKLPEVEQNSWKCSSVIQGYHSRSIYDLSWSKADDLIASASGDNSIAIYAASTNPEEVNTFICAEMMSQAHECDVNTIVWNPKKHSLLASGSDDGVIKLWVYRTENTDEIKIVTEAEEIIHNLTKVHADDTSSTPSANLNNQLTIAGYDDMHNLIQTLQNLQSGLVQEDDERILLEEAIGFKIAKRELQSVQLSGIQFNEAIGIVSHFTLITTGKRAFKFDISVDESKFALSIPRRSIKFFTSANELFLEEKTGDLYKILPTGKGQFLLGHLFTFSDLKLLTTEDDSEILYVISTDRDEKVRISNYPDTHKIESFCFGHQNHVRRIVVVDEKRFISIDQQDCALLWNTDDLKQTPRCSIKPEKITSMSRGANKRSRLSDGTSLQRELTR